MTRQTAPLTPQTQAGRRMLVWLRAMEVGERPVVPLGLSDILDIEQQATRAAPAIDVYADRNLVVQAYAQVMEDAGWHVAWGIDPSEPDWPVLYIETPEGQVSWHIPKAERVYEPADRTGSYGPMVWDGHTNEQKADRLRAALIPNPTE